MIKSSADSNQTISLITSEDIANHGAQNLADSIKYTQGVFIRPPSGAGAQRGEPTINIRGYSNNQIGMFIDGIPVHAIYGRTDWSQFSSFGISEISISKGYTSPLYGMNTMGGAVNIITSKPNDKLEIYGGYTFISNNEHRVKAQVGSNLGQWYFQVGYDFTDRDSINLSHNFKPTTLQTNTKMLNSYYQNHTLRAKVGYEPNENHEYSLNLIYAKGQKGGAISVNGGAKWDWPHYDKLTFYILGNSKFNDMISLNSKFYYDSFYNELQSRGRLTATGLTGTGFSSIYDDYSLGLIETLGFAFGENIDFKFGVNLRNDNHTSTDKNMGGSTTGTGDLRDFSTSIFAEYAQRITNWFRFVLNGSYDRNDVLKAKDWWKISLQGWTLQGILYFDINDYWNIYLNAGKKSKLPNLNSRYSSSMGRSIPNPDIRAESAINYEIGTTFDYESTKISAAVFYNDMNDMLIQTTVVGGCLNPNNNLCYKNVNAKEGYTYGVEFGFNQGFLDDRISFGANYAFIKKWAKGEKITDYPEHIVNVNFMTTPIKYFDIIAYFTYQSKQWYAITNGYAKNDHIYLVDLKVNLRPISSVPSFQLSLGAYNLLDKNYYYNSGYYQAGRRILMGVEYKY